MLSATMNNAAILIYLPDPFAVRASLYYLFTPDHKIKTLSARELANYDGVVITFDVSTLIDDMRRLKEKPPSTLIDICEAIRLSVGIPRDEGGERQWNIWPKLRKHFSSDSLALLFEQIFKSQCIRPDDGLLGETIKAAGEALRRLWDETQEKLKSSGEDERFIEIETRIQAIFNHRQYMGVSIDKKTAGELLNKISDEKYQSYHVVASELKKSPTGFNFWNIQPYLDLTDLAHLAEINDKGRLEDAFKLAAHNSTFAQSFLSFVESGRDETIIRRAIGSDSRVYPTFQIAGTITGRILVSDPYLQQLRRAYRGLISPDQNMSLVYFDYSQFEPGILAHLSQDKNLITAYNNGDMYATLSEKVFGRTDTRAISKRMFLAFCYGMSSQAIIKLISGQVGQENQADAYRKSVDDFFSVFSGLQKYRDHMANELKVKSWVSSALGNRRWRTQTGPLTPKENRWALNHPIQSTASLIFKEALIRLSRSFSHDSILLPVHDAVLMQFQSDKFLTEKTEAVKAIMIQVFKEHCPSIYPRVSAGPFSD